jgi:tyrosine-protein kinase Etk/Wzc
MEAERIKMGMEEKAANGSMEPQKSDGTSLVDFFIVVWKMKFLIILITGVSIVISMMYAFLQTPIYTANSTIMPISSNTRPNFSQYSGLASIAGISLPEGSNSSTSTQKIIAILKSRSLCEQVIQELDLIPILIDNPKNLGKRIPMNFAIETMQKKILIISESSKTNVITISADYKDPSYSMRIVDSAIDILEKIVNEKNLTAIKKTSGTLEEQIAGQAMKVHELQSKMAEFQENTKTISPEGQATGAMTLYSTMLEKKMGLEVEMSQLENVLSSDNPRIKNIKTQLEIVNEQIDRIESKTGVGSFSIGSAPEQIVAYQNIYRELEIATTIYSSLLIAYENQKLQETNNQVFFDIIDTAVIPEIRSKPNRKIIVVYGVIAGLMFGIMISYVINALDYVKTKMIMKSKK